MKKSVILVGVGGQGAILTAKILVNGLISKGYDVKMSEVHGMSQRGGSVSTQVHFGGKVYSPVVGKGGADILVAFEKMEAVRYADFLKPDGIAVINDFAMPSALTMLPKSTMFMHLALPSDSAIADALSTWQRKCFSIASRQPAGYSQRPAAMLDDAIS